MPRLRIPLQKSQNGKVQAARKPNSVLGDHSSRRRIATPLQQPTRKFRTRLDLHPVALRLGAPGRYARAPWRVKRVSCLFGLAPCGVCHAALIAERPVRSYRTFSPLPFNSLRHRKAVYSLLHWPSSRLNARVPDVIRHTALRSPDFPPPAYAHARPAAIIRPPASSSVSRVGRIQLTNC